MLGIILAATFALIADQVADQAVWWRSAGGLVVQGSNICSVVLTEQKDMAILSWDKQDAQSIAFAAAEPIADRSPVIVRIDANIVGETSINSNGAIILVLTRGLPIDDLLREATQISAESPEHPFVISINHSKMPQLLAALDKCRAALR
jgi:hypothetical protein